MPSGSSVRLGGWDGLVTVDDGNEFVPSGDSAWEISCDKATSTKANSDYEKRTKDPLGEEVAATTFVFATARRWPGKTEWTREHRENGPWHDVRVIDADNLVSWLEQAPKTAIWFAKLMGRAPQFDSEAILRLEEREESLHGETRDLIVGLSSEFAKLQSQIANLDATDTHSRESSQAHLDPQYAALSAKIDVARNLINRRLVIAAREELEELNKNEEMPDDLKFRIMTNLGACALALGEFEDARHRLLDAYELQPDSQKGIVNAALAAQLDGDSERAMELAHKARELDPKDSQATSILGCVVKSL